MSALQEVKRDYYGDSFFLFFNLNELFKIVLKSSTKFYGPKLNPLAQGTETKRFFPFFRVTYHTGETKGSPLSVFFRHCEIFLDKKFFPSNLFDVLRQKGC